MEKYKEIERSIIKKYRKEIWRKFVKAIQEYELIKENHNIMVCISGGKDSFLMDKCMQELQRYSKIKFNVCYVVMDPGYSAYNRDFIIDNAKILNIPIEIFESDIFEVVARLDSKSPCYLCARMRRGYLYSKAQELGCNKIALGHHFDDVIETTLLSMLYGAEIKTMMPKLHSDNFSGIELIRPLYLVKEQDIISWRNYNDLTFKVSPTNFKHTGIFPEQAANWDFIQTKVKEYKENHNEMKVLNLFAYTGCASMAASSAGADEVVHVDASKGINEWAKENMKLCNLENKKIRFSF